MDLSNVNGFQMAGAATLGGVGVTALALTTAILPAQTIGAVGLGSGLIWAGVRKSNGQSINPFQTADDKQAASA